ncbi:ParA family protein [Candidatus Deianiraea vastatrix]|uniref:Chromosome partitioning protein ParA n=1 Tax=Candidatus Deianiraea vastatrix TaxID=2163644 RepID=A0A5B8XCF3_9RICK|nr:AAA family ATPase [Candidatus Deianiraea vastatrix]QED22940.1 Chromosome partitioning protein ParA [Candidatus Deianiraea vastatrix]
MPKKIVSVINQKGGVGKTTTVVNLATSLAAIGQKTLIIDLDPQGNASTGVGIPQNKRSSTIYNVFSKNVEIKDAIHHSGISNLDIIPSAVELAAAEVELSGQRNLLKEILKNIHNDYDIILIDCPPSLGMLTINALYASNSILIPVQCEFFALEGLSHLIKTYETVIQNIDGNQDLEIEGVLLTMYDKRNNLTEEVEIEVRKVFGEAVYKTVIPRNIRISEAPSYGLPVMMYDIACPGSIAYINLAKEFVQRNGIVI